MIAHGTFVRATVAEGHVVDGIVLNSLNVGGEPTYIVAWEPQVAGQRVIAWAHQAFVAEKDLAPLVSLVDRVAQADPAQVPTGPAPVDLAELPGDAYHGARVKRTK